MPGTPNALISEEGYHDEQWPSSVRHLPSSPIPLPRHPEHCLDLPPVDLELPWFGVVLCEPNIRVRLLDERLHQGAAVVEFEEDGAAGIVQWTLHINRLILFIRIS